MVDAPAPASAADRAAVELLLGRAPQGDFAVVVREPGTGAPVVIRNEPFLDDGTPMPTRYWLVGARAVHDVSVLESEGGVKQAAAAIPEVDVDAAHRSYEAEREAAIPSDHEGPRPSGGVGGTRIGVKCLHAHYAHHLAGGHDAVGAWVARQLAADEDAP